MHYDEVNELNIKNQFQNKLFELTTSGLDPDFTIADSSFRIREVRTLSGVKSIYFV